MKRYIAITIGPVVDLLLSARKTRELWAGSYLLSYIMRETLCKLTVTHKEQILLPSPKQLNNHQENGAGLYPDRIYFEANSMTCGQVTCLIDEVLAKLSRQVHTYFQSLEGTYIDGKKTLVDPSFTYENTFKYFKSYFKIYVMGIEVDINDTSEENNIIKKISAQCDTQDLTNKVILDENLVNKEGLTPLKLFLHAINNSFLFEDGFDLTKKRFDSLIEIAARELKYQDQVKYQKALDFFQKNNDSDEDEALLAGFEENFKKDFKDYHKYIAIIHADGDNVGQIISAIGNDVQSIKGFSDKMLSFAQKATNKIIDYGGSPVYSGGDDLLFFAPVAINKTDKLSNRQTIFDLIASLDKVFKEEIKDNYDSIVQRIWEKNNTNNPLKLPTMSYGVSITYYKFPLYEARNLSYEMLSQAKSLTNDKNAVRVTFQKHSGQQMTFSIPKTSKLQVQLWKTFLELVKVNNNNGAFLNSFTYKLDYLKSILSEIAHDRHRLQCFFENNFNENYKSNQSFYNSLQDFIHALSLHYGNVNTVDGLLAGEVRDLLYGTLRLINFTKLDSKKKKENEIL